MKTYLRVSQGIEVFDLNQNAPGCFVCTHLEFHERMFTVAKKNGHHQESSVFNSKWQSLSFWTLRCWEGDSVWKASGEKGFPPCVCRGQLPPKIASKAYRPSLNMRLSRKSGQTGTNSEKKFFFHCIWDCWSTNCHHLSVMPEYLATYLNCVFQ